MAKNSFFENWLKPDLSNNPLFSNIPNMSQSPFGMKEMMEAGRKSIEAYSAAGQVMKDSAQVILKRQSEIMSQMVQDQSTMAKEIMAEGTPEEKIARGAELIRDAYEKTMSNAREVGDIANKSSREAFDILNDRITSSFDEIKATAEDAKEMKSKKPSKKSA